MTKKSPLAPLFDLARGMLFQRGDAMQNGESGEHLKFSPL